MLSLELLLLYNTEEHVYKKMTMQNQNSRLKLTATFSKLAHLNRACRRL